MRKEEREKRIMMTGKRTAMMMGVMEGGAAMMSVVVGVAIYRER